MEDAEKENTVFQKQVIDSKKLTFCLSRTAELSHVFPLVSVHIEVRLRHRSEDFNPLAPLTI